jgi:signal transduction histidine kinase
VSARLLALRAWLRPGRWLRPPQRWLKLPRRTVRLRLTLVYGGLFLLSGAGLLAITYVLVSHRIPVVSATGGSAPGGPGAAAGPGARVCFYLARPPAVPQPGPPPAGLPPAGPPAGGLTTGGLPSGSATSSCTNVAKLARQQRASELDQLLTESGIALGIMTVASIGLGWLMAGRVLRPLRTITATTRRISASNLHERLAMSGADDELKELGDTVDGLLARLEAAFVAQRQFVANASHELRTPLARLRTVMEVALTDPARSVSSLQAAGERVLAAGEQTERLTEALLTLARSQRGLDRRDPVDLAAITGEVLLARQPEAGLRGLALTGTLHPAAAPGDIRLTERLVANLVDNALRHNVPHGHAEVTTGCRAGHAVLSVSSTGPVVAPDDVGRLFQPFQRSRAIGRAASQDGLGLGLSIVAAIAQAHGAWLHACAPPGGGLSIEIGFPQWTGEPAGPVPAAAPTPVAGITH